MPDVLIPQRYSATSADAASAAMQAVFGVGTATVDGGATLSYDQQSLIDDGVSATRISSSGARIRVQAAEAPDLVVIAVHDGQVELRLGGETVTVGAGGLAVIPLDRTADLRWDDVRMDAFSFPRASIGRLLGRGAEPLRLHCARLVPRSEAVSALWRRTATVLAAEVLQQRELYESDMIREHAIDSLLGVTVEAFGISEVEEEDSASDRSVLQRSDAWMRHRLGEAISIPDVARGIGVSLRGLQLTYQRAGTSTPLMHLRRLRMTAARTALSLPAARRSTTVGAVARALGYSNLGRFSAHYRDEHGEPPAETLRAARASAVPD